MWDLPGPGLEPMSPTLAGGFLTTAPPGKSGVSSYDEAKSTDGPEAYAFTFKCLVSLFSHPPKSWAPHPPLSSILQHHSLLDNNLASRFVEKIEAIRLGHWPFHRALSHHHSPASATWASHHSLEPCPTRGQTWTASLQPSQRLLDYTIFFPPSSIFFLNSLFPTT